MTTREAARKMLEAAEKANPHSQGSPKNLTSCMVKKKGGVGTQPPVSEEDHESLIPPSDHDDSCSQIEVNIHESQLDDDPGDDGMDVSQEEMMGLLTTNQIDTQSFINFRGAIVGAESEKLQLPDLTGGDPYSAPIEASAIFQPMLYEYEEGKRLD